MERSRTLHGKTYYSPMEGGWGYELINGEYIQKKEYYFPHLCPVGTMKLFPMVENTRLDKCEWCGGEIHR